jgi:glycosyltransferase involved in cell wall biosynthesis
VDAKPFGKWPGMLFICSITEDWCRMKVLQVINNLQVGGAEVLLASLIPILRKDFEVTLYMLQSTGTSIECELELSGLDIYCVDNLSVYSPAQVLRLVQHLRNNHYDLIHVHLFPSQLWVALAAFVAGTRIALVTTEHSTNNRRRKPWFHLLDRWMYSQYASIACISEATGDELARWLPELKSKIEIIPNGIQVERFAQAPAFNRDRLGISDGLPVILFVGRFKKEKDHATLLRALAKVPNAQLVLVGDGPCLVDMEALAKILGVADRVHFLGSRQDVHELLKMADIYVHSSLWEGFGIAALEAMASGLPVVASRVPGLTNVIGEAGLFFEPGNDEQLATHLNTLLQCPQLRSELIEKGVARASEFKIEYTAERYASFYYKVMAISNSWSGQPD